MSYTLRDYQRNAGNEAYRHIILRKSKKPTVIVAPTGAGKSIIIAALASVLDGNIVVFQPSKELLEQNYNKYLAYGNDATIFSASKGKKEVGKVTFATIGSAVNMVEEFDKFDFAIVDECHNVSTDSNSMYRRFFREHPMPTIGLTATPIRMHRNSWGTYAKMINRQQGCFFKHIAYVIQVSELLEQGYLSPLTYYEYDFDESTLKTNSTGSEYTDESILRALEQQGTYERARSVIEGRREQGRKNILVFCTSKAECEIMKELVPNSEYVHSGLSKTDREDVLERFRYGDLDCVFNVGVLTTGFDHPEIDDIVLMRPTMSFGLYYQMAGRGMRISDEKEDCILDDLVGNVRKFGKIEDIKVENIPELGWCMHSQGRMLTNVPLDAEKPLIQDLISSKKRKQKRKQRQALARDKFGKRGANCDYVFAFGKFKNMHITQVPRWYLKWCLENLDINEYDNRRLFKEILYLYPDLSNVIKIIP